MRRLGNPPKIFTLETTQTEDWFATVGERLNVTVSTSNPTAAQLPEGQWAVGFNSATNKLDLWTKYGGVAYSLTGSQFPSSLGTSGYQKLPSGLIIQWGTVTAATYTSANTFQSTAFTFPIPFPTALYSVTHTLAGGLATSYVNTSIESRTTSGANFIYICGTTGQSPVMTYIAIGK